MEEQQNNQLSKEEKAQLSRNRVFWLMFLITAIVAVLVVVEVVLKFVH